MSPDSSTKFDQVENKTKISLNVAGGPWHGYDDVWGIAAKSGSNTPANPLEAEAGSLSRMTDNQMQSQIDEALKQNIY